MVASLLIAGVLSDRFERRRLLIVADLVRLVAIGAIAALALAETAELWQVIALVVVYGIGQALFQPAFSAIVPDVVPRDQLLQANAVRELMDPLGLRFAEPALGGLLIAVFGVGEALVVDAASFGVSALALTLMRASSRCARRRPESGAISSKGLPTSAASPGCGRRW